MPIHVKVLFAVANGEHARFVRPEEEDNTLHSFSRAVPEEGHRGTADHAHAQDKDKFAVWVAEQLNHAAASYDELVLAAPAHTLGVIRKALSSQVSAKLVGEVDKDLTKTADHELNAHFKQWVRPVHRAKVMP
jgi:protein required for attachment to host cells